MTSCNICILEIDKWFNVTYGSRYVICVISCPVSLHVVCKAGTQRNRLSGDCGGSGGFSVRSGVIRGTAGLHWTARCCVYAVWPSGRIGVVKNIRTFSLCLWGSVWRICYVDGCGGVGPAYVALHVSVSIMYMERSVDFWSVDGCGPGSLCRPVHSVEALVARLSNNVAQRFGFLAIWRWRRLCSLLSDICSALISEIWFLLCLKRFSPQTRFITCSWYKR